MTSFLNGKKAKIDLTIWGEKRETKVNIFARKWKVVLY